MKRIFNKKSTLLLIVLFIIVGVIIFILNNHNYKKINNKTEKNYQYKAFEPIINNNDKFYDYTHDMSYKDRIYYKKINSYEEYNEIKSRWNNILEMNESDFENNFMLITAIENTSMEGLTVENVETYNDGLYISLIHYEDGETYNKNETCISYIISREMEKENIYVTRNLRNSEKDMSTELRIGPNENINDRIYFKHEEYRRIEKEISEDPNSHSFSLAPIDWEDMIYRKIRIEQKMEEIDFSELENLGNDFYIKKITNYSEYLKMFNNYDLPEMSWEDFKYLSAIVVLNKNLQRNIEIEDKDGTIYLGADNLNELENNEKLKYNGFFVLVPNYRVLKEDLVKVYDK